MTVHPSIYQALRELRFHPMRTLLTLLGMIFGVGAVVAMLGVGEGAQREALSLVDSLGLRNVLVQSIPQDQDALERTRERSAGLSRLDVQAALETLPMVETFSAQKEVRTFAVYSLHGSSEAQVFGVTPSHFELSKLLTSAGRILNDGDESRFAQVAVLGSEAARDMFPGRDPLGAVVKVNHLWLRVVGVVDDRELTRPEFEGIKLGGEGRHIYMPLSTVHKRLRLPELADEIDVFRLRLKADAAPAPVAASLAHLLDRRHSGEKDYRIVVPAQLLNQHQATQRIFTIVMSCVAGISLLVGGIGIMNIMLATVLERRSEVGLMRAVGARRRDIVEQFLAEALVISTLGAILGVLLGIVLSYAIAAFAGWSVAWSIPGIIIAVTFCVAIGMGFGVYPARKAAEVDPITALQSI